MSASQIERESEGEAILLVLPVPAKCRERYGHFHVRFEQAATRGKNENRCWSDRALPPERRLDGAPSLWRCLKCSRRMFRLWSLRRPALDMTKLEVLVCGLAAPLQRQADLEAGVARFRLYIDPAAKLLGHDPVHNLEAESSA